MQQIVNNQNKTLALTSKESCDLATENYHLKAILAKDDISPYELTKVNEKLALSTDNKPLDKKEIAGIVYELYHNPSYHIDIIKTIRQWIEQREIEFNKQEYI